MFHVARVALVLCALAVPPAALAQASPTPDAPHATAVAAEPDAELLWQLLASVEAWRIELPEGVRSAAMLGLQLGFSDFEEVVDLTSDASALHLTVGALARPDGARAFLAYEITREDGSLYLGGTSIGPTAAPRVPALGPRFRSSLRPDAVQRLPLGRWLPVHAVVPAEGRPERPADTLVFYLYLSEAPLGDVLPPAPDYATWEEARAAYDEP